MSERFRFVKLNNTKAAKLLEAFRLYGTKDGYYTVRSLWLVYALTDTCKSFYFTLAYYHVGNLHNNTRDTVEYVFFCGEKLALVRCEMRRVLKDLRILAVHGENPFTQQQLVEMITFYEENNNRFIHEHKSRWIDWQSQNTVRKRRLMMKNHEVWAFDLLAKEYRFHVLNRKQQSVLWDCICKYGDKFKNHGDAQLGYALTDARHSFWLTFCFFMSDGIKHCNEPDDYEYAVVTDKTTGVVRIWFQDGVQIKKIKGEISLEEWELCEAVYFYETFCYDWEHVYTKLHGHIPKRPYDL